MPILKLALRPWCLHPFTQILSAFVIGFLLFLGGIIFWIHGGLNPILVKLRNEQVVTVFLKPHLSITEKQKLKLELESQFRNDSITLDWVDTQQVLTSLSKTHPRQGDYLKQSLVSLGSSIHQVVPEFFSLTGVISSGKISQIEKIPEVESVESSQERYKHTVSALKALKSILKILMLGMAITLLISLIHQVQLNMVVHRKVLYLMRNWGAGDFELRAPGILSGLMTGIFGAFLAISIGVLGFSRLQSHLKSLSPLLANLKSPTLENVLFVLGVGILCGAISGMLVHLPNDQKH